MRRLIVAAAALCAFPLLAWAGSDVGGHYTVKGTNLDGSSYSGEADINILSKTTCEIAWTTGSTTSKGICMRNGDAFAAGYVMGDAIGLVIYEMKDDGTLDGLWTITGKDGAGTEVLTPAH
jgi:hypothetical protein